MKKNDHAVRALVDSGLTDLEARVYILLLGESPLTGYRTAKLLGRSVPNIYKTLSAMALKGLVMCSEDQGTSTYVPTPLETWLQQRSVKVERDLSRVRKVFSDLEVSRERIPPGVYSLENREQVMLRAAAIAGNAKKALTVSADSEPLRELKDELEKAAERGVAVIVNCYEEIDIPGCRMVTWNRRSQRRPWRGNWLIVAADGSESLNSFFSPGGEVVDARWISNPFISTVLHHGRSADTVLAAILNRLSTDGVSAEFRDFVRDLVEQHVFSIPHDPLHKHIDSEIENRKG